MKLNEEKELSNITQDFTKAIVVFKKKDFDTAVSLFDGIIKKYSNSDYYSVQEIHVRSKVYKNIAESVLSPAKIELNSDEDYLSAAVYYLNSGEKDEALKCLQHLEKKKLKDPFLDYLQAIFCLNQDEVENSLLYLKSCVEKDKFFKILAANEPDFSSLLENEAFMAIVG